MFKLIPKWNVAIRKKLRSISGNSEPFQTRVIVYGTLKGFYIEGFKTR